MVFSVITYFICKGLTCLCKVLQCNNACIEYSSVVCKSFRVKPLSAHKPIENLILNILIRGSVPTKSATISIQRIIINPQNAPNT